MAIVKIRIKRVTNKARAPGHIGQIPAITFICQVLRAVLGALFRRVQWANHCGHCGEVFVCDFHIKPHKSKNKPQTARRCTRRKAARQEFQRISYSTFTGLVEHVDSVTDSLAQICIVSAFVTNCYKLAFVDMVDCLRTIEKRGHGPRGEPLFMRVWAICGQCGL